MAFSVAENLRIETIEKLLNELQTAITNLASQQQLRQLAVLKQEEIDTLAARVTTLETQVQALQSEV